MLPRALSVLTALVAVVALGCTAGPNVAVEPLPDVPVWMVGDSLASGTATAMSPRPPQFVSPAAGFTEYPPSRALETAEAAIEAYGPPETMLVMAGVGDTPRAETAEIIAGMEAFSAAMTARGIRLIWLAEPGFTYAAQLEPLTAWIKTQPEWVDCRWHKGVSVDGVHPVDYTALGACTSANLAGMGLNWTPDPG